MTRGRKLVVSSELRREWLRRASAGESAPRIATADGYDVRTVRKHLDVARQEFEMQDARHAVLRQALEQHYKGLCGVAERMSDSLTGDSKRVIDFGPGVSAAKYDSRLSQALRQHLPKAPVWKEMDELNNLQGRVGKLKDDVRKLVVSRTEKKLNLKSSEARASLEKMQGFVDQLAFRLETIAEGWEGLKGIPFVKTRYGPGEIRIERGAYAWIVPEDKADYFPKVADEIESEMVDSEEHREWQASLQRIRQLQESIREELAVITLRRVVPGRCIYCPL